MRTTFRIQPADEFDAWIIAGENPPTLTVERTGLTILLRGVRLDVEVVGNIDPADLLDRLDNIDAGYFVKYHGLVTYFLELTPQLADIARRARRWGRRVEWLPTEVATAAVSRPETL